MRKEINFRQLGGYAIKEKTIRRNVIYRCGALGDCSEEERQEIAALGIRTILDFRSDGERRHVPDPEIPGAVNLFVPAWINKDGEQLDMSPAGIERIIGQKNSSETGLNLFLRYMYEGMLFRSHAYQVMFDALLDEDVPLLFHCSAGKDRTGTAAILILLALGADEDLITKDYLLTNDYRKAVIERVMAEKADLIARDPEEKDKVIAYEGVFEQCVHYVLDGILARYPDYDAYLEAEFGLTEAKRQKLRDLYLE
ncbi:MAG: tyrosine-protein phosphatase [Solobacterium sp.]|nr:tyrosine-protein phosphatase [Solobacterium sp.]